MNPAHNEIDGHPGAIYSRSVVNPLNKLSNSAMGNITSCLRHISTLGECCRDNTKAIANSKSASPAMSGAKPGHAYKNLIIDQPDSSTHSREYSEKQEEVYLQVTVLSKKLRTEDDGTIILSPISESFVS